MSLSSPLAPLAPGCFEINCNTGIDNIVLNQIPTSKKWFHLCLFWSALFDSVFINPILRLSNRFSKHLDSSGEDLKHTGKFNLFDFWGLPDSLIFWIVRSENLQSVLESRCFKSRIFQDFGNDFRAFGALKLIKTDPKWSLKLFQNLKTSQKVQKPTFFGQKSLKSPRKMRDLKRLFERNNL